MADAFAGFPKEAFEFFKRLEKNNNREWFAAQKDTYERAVREPVKALMAELEPLHGPARISRINRDMRFAYGREPYKSHLAAGVDGYYVSVSKEGLYIGAGLYKPEPALLRRLREAIATDSSGRELSTIVATLRGKGYKVDTHERMPSAPRGYSADHPRIDLLRMKDIHAGKMFASEPWLATPKALNQVARVMKDLVPFQRWLRANVGSQEAAH